MQHHVMILGSTPTGLEFFRLLSQVAHLSGAIFEISTISIAFIMIGFFLSLIIIIIIVSSKGFLELVGGQSMVSANHWFQSIET